MVEELVGGELALAVAQVVFNGELEVFVDDWAVLLSHCSRHKLDIAVGEV